MRFAYIVIAILFMGCTAEKRLARIEKNHPHLFAYKDSFQVKIIPALYTDTSKVMNIRDSFVITNRDVITKVYRHYDTVSIFQEFPQVADTVHHYHETTIQVASDDKWRLLEYLTLYT